MMISYLIEVSACWALFYAFYLLVISKDTFFTLNRGYLLLSIVLGIALPLIEFFPENQMQSAFATVFLPEVTVTATGLPSENLEQTFSWMQLLMLTYWAVVIGLFSRFMFGIGQIIWLAHSGNIQREKNYFLVNTEKEHPPFSFFKFLFLSEKTALGPKEKQQVIRHEIAHIEGWHSMDVIALELLSIVFWFNPLLYWFKKSLVDVHEYLADAAVLETTPTARYGRLLIAQSIPGIRLANNFNNSQLKKRINMMTKSKSSQRNLLKYTIAIPLLVLTMFIFSCTEKAKEKVNTSPSAETELLENKEREPKSAKELTTKTNSTPEISATAKKVALPLPDDIEIKKPVGNQIYQIVEQMPRFPGCEGSTDSNAEKKACAEKKMLEFIYQNIKYPAEARDNGIEGMVVLSFIVDKKGNITKAKILRDLGGGCGVEALRIINSMPKWTPGRQKGKAVKVQFNLPVRFKLAN